MTRPTLTLTLAGALVALLSTQGVADDDKSGVLTTWTLLAGDNAVGTETRRIVKSDAGTFASGERKVKGNKEHVQYFLQRTTDGDIVKYRRVDAGRKGQGVMVFTVDGKLRITGVNTGEKTTDLLGVKAQHIWDARFPTHLTYLAPKLKGGEAVVVPWFDPATKKTGTARLIPGTTTRMTDPKKQLVEVTTWTTEGQPGAAATLYVEGGRLIGAKLPAEALILKGWTWEGKAPAGDDESDSPKKVVDPDDDGSTDPGEGP